MIKRVWELMVYVFNVVFGRIGSLDINKTTEKLSATLESATGAPITQSITELTKLIPNLPVIPIPSLPNIPIQIPILKDEVVRAYSRPLHGDENCYFNELPFEMILEILKHLDSDTIGLNLNPTCHFWHEICKSDTLWTVLIRRDIDPTLINIKSSCEKEDALTVEELYYKLYLKKGTEYLGWNTPPDRCRIKLFDSVFDIGRFLELHPGGAEILKEFAGTDATATFNDVAHSAEAVLLLQQFKVGASIDLPIRARSFAEARIIHNQQQDLHHQNQHQNQQDSKRIIRTPW